MSICWGAMDYGKGKVCLISGIQRLLSNSKAYDLANQTAYLDSMLRWGLDYLIKVRTVPLEGFAYADYTIRFIGTSRP